MSFYTCDVDKNNEFPPTFFRKSLDRNQLLAFLRSSPKVKHKKKDTQRIKGTTSFKVNLFWFPRLFCQDNFFSKLRVWDFKKSLTMKSFSFKNKISQAILPESVRNPPQQQLQATRPFTGSKTAGQGVLFTDSLKPEALTSLEAAYSRLQVC